MFTERPIRVIHDLGKSGEVTAIAFSPDGKLVAFGNPDGITLAEPVTGKDVLRFDANMIEPIARLAFTANESHRRVIIVPARAGIHTTRE